MRWLDSITDSKDMNMSKLQEIVEDKKSLAAHGVKNSWTDLASEQAGVRHCHTVGCIALMRVTLSIGDHRGGNQGKSEKT